MKWLGIMWMAAMLALAPAYGLAQPQKTTTPAEKQAYQKKAAADLENLRQRIDDLKVKGEKAVPQMKRSYDKAVLRLQKQAIDARNKLAALEKASGPEWSRLQADAAKALDDLKKGLQETEQRL